MWIDPNNSDRFYIANDKGASVTYDRGNRFIMFDNMDIGQFYAVTADNRDPYYLYGGLQDSGNWGGPSNSRDYNGILGDHWFKFHSGDGFHTTVDPEDWRIVYTERQRPPARRGVPAVGLDCHAAPADDPPLRRGHGAGRQAAVVPLQLELAADPLAARLEDPVPRR
jgi:hypothetical protein